MTSRGLRSLVENSAYLVAIRVLTILARVVYVVALAHFLGPELYGLFAYGTSWYLAFLPLALLGLDVIAARAIGGRRDGAAGLVLQTLTLRGVAAVTAAVASALIGLWLEDSGLVRSLLLMFSVALLGRALAIWADGVFTAFEKAGMALRMHLIFRPIEIALGIAILFAGGGVLDLAVVHTLVWWLHAVTAVFQALRLINGTWQQCFRVSGVLPLLGAGIPLGLVVLSEFWFLNGPLVVFRHTADGDGELGQLSLALQVLMVTATLGTAAAKGIVPILTRSALRADKKDIRFAEEALRISAIIGLMAWLTSDAWAAAAVNLVFGDRYAAAGVLLSPMLALLYPYIGAAALAHVLMARGASWILAGWGFVSIALMSLSQPWLSQLLGLTGVVVAMGLGLSNWLLGLALLLRSRGGLRLKRALLAPLGLVVVVLVVFELGANLDRTIAYAVSVVLTLVVGLYTLRARPGSASDA